MIFNGIRRVFSTVNESQYETIGAFWDEMSLLYGIENLQGLGYSWTDHTIDYVIGSVDSILPGSNVSVELPDSGWQSVTGLTSQLGPLYNEVYKEGPLVYEIETFTEDGRCTVRYFR